MSHINSDWILVLVMNTDFLIKGENVGAHGEIGDDTHPKNGQN